MHRSLAACLAGTRMLALGCALLSLAGCEDATSPDEALVGSYALYSIDGQTVPVQTSSGFVMVSGSIELNPDQTCVIRWTFLLNHRVSRPEEQCTYARHRDTITFTAVPGGATLDAAYTPGTITLDLSEGTDVRVFKRVCRC